MISRLAPSVKDTESAGSEPSAFTQAFVVSALTTKVEMLPTTADAGMATSPAGSCPSSHSRNMSALTGLCAETLSSVVDVFSTGTLMVCVSIATSSTRYSIVHVSSPLAPSATVNVCSQETGSPLSTVCAPSGYRERESPSSQVIEGTTVTSRLPRPAIIALTSVELFVPIEWTLPPVPFASAETQAIGLAVLGIRPMTVMF